MREPRPWGAGQGDPVDLTDPGLTQPLTRLAARRQALREHDDTPGSAPTSPPSATAPPSPTAPSRPPRPGNPAGGPPSSSPPPSSSRSSAALAKASALMAAGTAVSRVLGFVRAAALARVIGLTVGGNTFGLANTIPNTLYLLIAGGVLNAVLVPQVVKAMKRVDGGAEYLDRLVTSAVIALGVVTTLLVVASPLVVSLYGHTLLPAQRGLAVAFSLWCLPQVFFYALYTLLGQVLNARGRFGAYMWAPVINNVVAVLGIAIFAVTYGVHGWTVNQWTPAMIAVLGGTSTLGVVAQALVLFPPLRASGVHLRPRFGLRGVGLGSAGRSTVWVVAGLIVSNVAFLVMSNVSLYAAGQPSLGVPVPGLAVWQNAYLLFMLPHSLIAVSIVTALFTRMSQAATAGNVRAVRADVSSGLRTIGVTSVLATAGLVVVAEPAAVILNNQSPAFSHQIGLVIAAMALGMVPFSANYLLQRAFYAFEDARTPFVTQTIAVLVWSLGGLISAALLPPQHIVAGAALSMSAGQLCAAAVAVVRLRERLRGIDGFRVFRTHARLVVAALLAGLAGWFVVHLTGEYADHGPIPAAAVAAAAGIVMVGVYGAGLVVMQVEEVRPLARRIARPLARRLARR